MLWLLLGALLGTAVSAVAYVRGLFGMDP